MILLDTPILAYAAGTDHPLREPCRALLDAIAQGSLRGSTTIEVIQEFAHIRARRRPRADAAAVARDYAEGLQPLIRPGLEELIDGLDLFSQTAELGAFDAVLAATARHRDVPLASADRAFRSVVGLTYLDPTSPSFLDEAFAA